MISLRSSIERGAGGRESASFARALMYKSGDLFLPCHAPSILCYIINMPAWRVPMTFDPGLQAYTPRNTLVGQKLADTSCTTLTLYRTCLTFIPQSITPTYSNLYINYQNHTFALFIFCFMKVWEGLTRGLQCAWEASGRRRGFLAFPVTNPA